MEPVQCSKCGKIGAKLELNSYIATLGVSINAESEDVVVETNWLGETGHKWLCNQCLIEKNNKRE